MKALVLCVSLLLVSLKETRATDFTLQASNTDLMEWPRIIYDGSMINLCRGDFQFQFKTFLKTAVVLYQDDGGESDFFTINLENGRLRVIAAFGISENWHTDYTTSINTYNDFKWHTVGVRLNCSYPCVEISVDGEVKYKEPGRERCKFTSDLQIGGFTKQRLDDTNSISYRVYEANYIFR